MVTEYYSFFLLFSFIFLVYSYYTIKLKHQTYRYLSDSSKKRIRLEEKVDN